MAEVWARAPAVTSAAATTKIMIVNESRAVSLVLFEINLISKDPPGLLTSMREAQIA